jgi:hypothetical protein
LAATSYARNAKFLSFVLVALGILEDELNTLLRHNLQIERQKTDLRMDAGLALKNLRTNRGSLESMLEPILAAPG